MNNSFDHLSESTRNELKIIVSIIRNKCDDVEMIILFGSYARGDYKIKADLPNDRKSGHASDYDILVVVGQKKTVEDINHLG
jgi:predicted nucleotidyltransferase